MASKHGGRLDKSSLEKALEAAFNDQQEETPTGNTQDPSSSGFMIHGKETVGGVDPDFAGKLHDKLASTADKDAGAIDEGGLRAPACTRMLNAEELAALEDDEDLMADAEKVVRDSTVHGTIDHVDPKLVTELNKKLSDEVDFIRQESAGKAAKPAAIEDPNKGFAGNLQSALGKLGGSEAELSGHQAQACPKCGNVYVPDAKFCRICGTKREARASAGFDADLSAALQNKLQAGSDGLTAAIDQRFSSLKNDGEEMDEVSTSGLRAPQPTVKLSAQALAGLDDDEDEVVDSALLVAQTHGAIESIDKSLVAELGKKLGGLEQPSSSSAQGPSAPAGAGPGAPIDNNFVTALQQKLQASDTDDNVEAEVIDRGCRAPHATMKLTQDMLADLGDDEFIQDVDDPLSVPAAAAAALTKIAGTERPDPLSPSFDQYRDAEEDNAAEVGGLKAPASTQLITADMLAGLDDEDDIDVAPDPAAAAGMNLTGGARNDVVGSDKLHVGPDLPKPDIAKPKKGVGFFGGGGVDQDFAASLQQKLAGEAPAEPPEVFTAADEPDSGKYMSGLKAPATTQTLSADQLANLDDDDEPLMMDAPMGAMDMPLSQGRIEYDEPNGGRYGSNGLNSNASGTRSIAAGMVAGLNMGANMGEPPVQERQTGPSAAQLATLSAAARALEDVPSNNNQQGAQALTMDNVSTTKVIQTARGLPEGGDMWGQARPLTSSCKLRLAWLSKDEVRKENEQLRKEIASLRAEIDMHRKEATLARKI